MRQRRVIAALAARRRLLSVGAIDPVQAGGMDTERTFSGPVVSGRCEFPDARLHGQRLAAAEQQLARFDIKRMIFKNKLRAALPGRANSQGIIRLASCKNQAPGKAFRPRVRHPARTTVAIPIIAWPESIHVPDQHRQPRRAGKSNVEIHWISLPVRRLFRFFCHDFYALYAIGIVSGLVVPTTIDTGSDFSATKAFVVSFLSMLLP